MFLIFSQNTFAYERFELKVYVGETIDLDSFLIDNLSISANEEMEWQSGNKNILNINLNAVVTGVKDGAATVHVRSTSESSRIATIKIKVLSMVEGFELIDEEVSIRVGEVYNLGYKIDPVDGYESVYNEDITLKSIGKSVVEVDDNGQIKGIKEVTVNIVARTKDGNLKDEISIHVSGLKEDIVIDNG